ncbi:MAG: YjgP/YjgQ family permease [Planctomycetes bacterium]|nr:YjgP/YjgQ family permease [Planctomycetota bacterium]
MLTRYILLELTKTFLLALTGLTVMMLVVGVVREAVQQSLPLAQILWLLPYILPDALRIAVPATLLLATTVVYGRMSGSNEIVAAKAMGISPVALLWPIYTLAFVLSLVTVWLNDVAVSWGRNGAQRVVIEAVEEIAYGMLRTQRAYSSPRFSINVKRVDGRKLVRPIVTVAARGNVPTVTITAAEAELRSDRQENVLKVLLRDGTIEVGDHGAYRFSGVHEEAIPLDDASRAKRTANLPSWTALREIDEQVVHQKSIIENYEQELAARAAYQMLTGDFDALAAPRWKVYHQRLQNARGHFHRLKTEPHRRWSAGFSCLCFVWVGAPLAIWLRNRDFLTSFFLCFLPILIVYYPLLAYGVDGAKSGTIWPESVWAGNLLLLVAGCFLLKKVIRY